MGNSKILFVAFSHSLTEQQKEGWDKIVQLKEVAPDLQAKFSQVPADADLSYIQQLAKYIVSKAFEAGATHFFL